MQGASLQSGGVGLRRLPHAYWGVFQEQGEVHLTPIVNCWLLICPPILSLYWLEDSAYESNISYSEASGFNIVFKDVFTMGSKCLVSQLDNFSV